MAISRAQLLKELLPGLNALFGMEYARYGEEHKEIYETETSERSFEEEVKLSEEKSKKANTQLTKSIKEKNKVLIRQLELQLQHDVPLLALLNEEDKKDSDKKLEKTKSKKEQQDIKEKEDKYKCLIVTPGYEVELDEAPCGRTIIRFVEEEC